jgi:hypothetical protein
LANTLYFNALSAFGNQHQTESATQGSGGIQEWRTGMLDNGYQELVIHFAAHGRSQPSRSAQDPFDRCCWRTMRENDLGHGGRY